MKREQFDLWRKETEISAPLTPEEDQRSKSNAHENRLKTAGGKNFKKYENKRKSKKSEENKR